MTHEEALAKLAEHEHNSDFEAAHSEADDVLCALLNSLGYGDVVEAWEKIGKWYA